MDNEKEIEKKENMETENSKEYAPRQKILVLRDIFYENADEKHGITMKEIQSKLQTFVGNKFMHSAAGLKSCPTELFTCIYIFFRITDLIFFSPSVSYADSSLIRGSF